MVLKVLNEVSEVVEAVSVLVPHQALKLSISTMTRAECLCFGKLGTKKDACKEADLQPA
jgi:hypothetical protein